MTFPLPLHTVPISRRALLRRWLPALALGLTGLARPGMAGRVSAWSSAATAPSDDTAWLAATARRLIEGCRVPGPGGSSLFTPDGKGNYRALWTRDFAYMVEHAGDLMDPGEVEAAIGVLVAAIRADGATPDRVQPDGLAVYTGGPPEKPLGEPNLDNGPFLVIAADEFLRRAPAGGAQARLRAWLPSLHRALDWTPRATSGLVWNDPAKPHSPYGFTDTVGKTGELLFESLLYWTACRRLARMESSVDGDRARVRELRLRARGIERHLERLWDPGARAFLAATRDCRQLDVWGNAYALWLEFPLGRRRRAVLDWVHRRHEDFLWHGQVRHLLRGQYWDRLLAPVERERYQNGAYWATASGWVLYALAQKDPDLARRRWRELLADFRTGGICECIHDGYRQLPSYVVSATNPLGFARRLGW